MDEEAVIQQTKERASNLLNDSKAFDTPFEKLFSTFDKNKDGSIGAAEYIEFFRLMLGNNNINRIMLNFDRSDSNKDGSIDKAEFKKEVKKRLREFVNNKK